MCEDSEDDEQVRRIMFVDEQKISAASYQYQRLAEDRERQKASESAAPPSSAADQSASPDSDNKEERMKLIHSLRLNWSRNFLERGGFQFIIQQLYALDVTSTDKKQTEFMFTLARVFLTAAFETDPQKQIGQAVRLTRKSSSIDDNDTVGKKANESKEHKKHKIQELLKNEFGMEILLSTNYARLQQKILSLIFSLLQQSSFSLEDKIIIENAITIWVGALLYKPELFAEFQAFVQGESTTEDFILSGLIFCP